jgi:hypothetical protein
MITYEKISKKPQVAMSLIGMSLEEFNKLSTEFERAHTGRVSVLQYTQRHKLKRRRAVGAGRKHKYALRDRLLMTLFWLRAYTTYEVLGSFYSLDKTTVEDNLKDVWNTLAQMTNFDFDRPQAEIPKLHSMQDVLNAFPELLLIIDTQSQDIE